MAEDSTSPDKLKQLDDRLNYLESVARETVARLYAVEKHLGLVFKAVPRQLDQPPPVDQQTRDSRLRAVEDALKSVPPIAEQPMLPAEAITQEEPAEKPPQDKPTSVEPSAPEPPSAKPVVDDSLTRIPAAIPPTADQQPDKGTHDAPSPVATPPRDKRVVGAPVPQGPPPPIPTSRPAAPSIAP